MNIRTLLPALWERSLAVLAAVAIAAVLSSCAHLNPPEPEPAPQVAEKKPPPKPIAPPPPSPLYEWYGSDDYVSHIEIDINAQKALFYSGDKQVGWTTVASGVYKYPTPTGTFAVTEKVQNKKSNLYGKIYNKNGKLVKSNAKMGVHPVPAGGSFKGAPMPYFLRLTNDGIGMHAGPIPRPGNRASHGCIRMPKKFAPILYNHVDIGTPVTIKGKGPTYASYVAKQRKSTPKPAPAAVAEAKPPLAPTGDTTSVSATPSDPASGVAEAIPETTTVTGQPTEITASSPTTEASPAPLPSSADGVSADPSAYVAAPKQGPDAEGVPANVETPAVPPSSPANSVPEATAPYAAAPAATPTPTPGVATGTTDASVAPAPAPEQRPAPVEATLPPTAAEPSVQREG